MSTWLEVKQWSDEQTLHPVPKSVLHELVSYFGQDGAVHPTQKRIAQSTGWSERTVRNCLVYLAENGYIERVRKYNGHAFKVMTSYEFCIEQAMIIPLYTWSEADQPAASCR
jgi:CTP-dependent riboflavin kinase